ncbi:MAG: FAD-dependent oxidoreductase [Proteobacteria bacterium]|uniref:Thioredoxin reductase n=1 Tax=Candidatus Enterousia excrementavium TaxID=2840789 RepID=A0A940IA02_9PROT|nr:FAD-dependent oxidoreductase [Candidatus Enterousia excrementavium]
MNDVVMHDVIILGSGPAGLTAALYCARGGKDTLVLGGDTLGGQTAGIAVLENYPGWAGSGLELSEFMKKQAESFGAKIKFISAQNIAGDAETGFNILCDDGNRYIAKAVIIATGASPRKLQIEGARELFGKGVSYCATCDGFFYSEKDVVVMGGGNSALNDALYLADIARSVKIVYRKGAFTRAEAVLRNRVSERENIECLFNTDLKKIIKRDDEKLVITTTDDNEIICDGLFVAIGHEANTDYLSEDVARDNMGRLAPSALPRGMFVAGDVESDIKMQIATAVGTGCSAAMDAIAYLNQL